MARLVKRFRNKPYAVSIGGETQYFCGCGLSNAQPFCDGTHSVIQAEEPEKLYWYNEGTQRRDTTDSYPHIRSDQKTKDA